MGPSDSAPAKISTTQTRCMPIKQTHSLGIYPAILTRTGVTDLVSLNGDRQSLTIFTAETATFSVHLGSLLAEDHILLHLGNAPIPPPRTACAGRCIRFFKASASTSESKERRIDVDLQIESRIVSESLEALADVLPAKTYLDIHTAFLQARRASQQEGASADDIAEMQALHTALIGEPTPSEKRDEGTGMSDGQSRSTFAGVSPPATGQHAASTLVRSPSFPPEILELVLLTLSLKSEEYRLLSSEQDNLEVLAKLRSQVAHALGYSDWWGAAGRDRAPMSRERPRLNQGQARRLSSPIDLHKALFTKLQGGRASLLDPVSQIKHLQDALAASVTEVDSAPGFFFGKRPRYPITTALLSLYGHWHDDSSEQPASERIVLELASMGWTTQDIDALAVGPALPIREAIRQCQLASPSGWPQAAYALLQRPDQVAQLRPDASSSALSVTRKGAEVSRPRRQYAIDRFSDPSENIKPLLHHHHLLKRKEGGNAAKDRAMRFSSDLRLEDVMKMLTYTETVTMKMREDPTIT